MRGSDFARDYGTKGLAAWEAAALEAARSGDVVDWPWSDVHLVDASGHTAIVRARSDVFAVGSAEDHVRLPLTPSKAQEIANLSGCLLPTPWLEYQIWRAASVKLPPTAMVPNKGAVMSQYVEHDKLVEAQVAGAAGSGGLVSGHKKGVVVSNIWRPGKVVIFGWYKQSGADVFDDGTPMTNPKRQPTQPLSNVHGADYLDYSHGIRFLHPVAVVDGQETALADLYQHPTLSKLVSNEGPVRAIRYPAPNAPPPNRPVSASEYPAASITIPPYEDIGLAKVVQDYESQRKKV